MGGSDGESEKLEAFIGLRVYTQGGDQVSIIGTTKEEAERLYASAMLDVVSA